MSVRVLTEVSATVEPDREAALRDGFAALTAEAVPDGLLRSELVRGPEGVWRIQTLWRDEEALAAMRASPEPPAAPRLFRSVGAEPTLVVLRVEASMAP